MLEPHKEFYDSHIDFKSVCTFFKNVQRFRDVKSNLKIKINDVTG